jgi:hypothetical protein
MKNPTREEFITGHVAQGFPREAAEALARLADVGYRWRCTEHDRVVTEKELPVPGGTIRGLRCPVGDLWCMGVWEQEDEEVKQ